MKIIVDVRWDDEAQVWYALARDKVGLATESESLDGLREKILVILPDLFGQEAAERADVELVVHGIEKPSNTIAAE